MMSIHFNSFHSFSSPLWSTSMLPMPEVSSQSSSYSTLRSSWQSWPLPPPYTNVLHLAPTMSLSPLFPSPRQPFHLSSSGRSSLLSQNSHTEVYWDAELGPLLCWPSLTAATHPSNHWQLTNLISRVDLSPELHTCISHGPSVMSSWVYDIHPDSAHPKLSPQSSRLGPQPPSAVQQKSVWKPQSRSF